MFSFISWTGVAWLISMYMQMIKKEKNVHYENFNMTSWLFSPANEYRKAKILIEEKLNVKSCICSQGGNI